MKTKPNAKRKKTSIPYHTTLTFQLIFASFILTYRCIKEKWDASKLCCLFVRNHHNNYSVYIQCAHTIVHLILLFFLSFLHNKQTMKNWKWCCISGLASCTSIGLLSNRAMNGMHYAKIKSNQMKKKNTQKQKQTVCNIECA